MVSYLNALPFRYGLERGVAAEQFDVRLAVPSGCADQVRAGDVDIALLPLAEVYGLRGYRIFSPFCIGARGAVRTVCLFSNSPLERVERVYLDGDSRTSVRLVRYLAGAHWGISPRYLPLEAPQDAAPLRVGEAVVLIGDKVFGQEGRYAYRYDLAEEWVRYSGFPAVFAMWVVRDGLEVEGVEAPFNAGLAYGVERVGEALAGYEGPVAKDVAYGYLTGNIAYWLDLPMVRGAAALGRAIWGCNGGGWG